MTERVPRSADVARLDHELKVDAFPQVPRELDLGDVAHSAEQIEPEHDTNDGSCGERRLSLRREPFHPRQERLAYRARYRPRAEQLAAQLLSGPNDLTGLDERSEELLGEEGIAFCALEDRIPKLDRLIALEDRVQERPDRVRPEPVELELAEQTVAAQCRDGLQDGMPSTHVVAAVGAEEGYP